MWSDRAFVRRRDDLVVETKFQPKILNPGKTGLEPLAKNSRQNFFCPLAILNTFASFLINDVRGARWEGCKKIIFMNSESLF